MNGTLGDTWTIFDWFFGLFAMVGEGVQTLVGGLGGGFFAGLISPWIH